MPTHIFLNTIIKVSDSVVRLSELVHNLRPLFQTRCPFNVPVGLSWQESFNTDACFQTRLPDVLVVFKIQL